MPIGRPHSKKGIVAAGHEETAKAAAEILSDGGNAYDAVVAALVASCIPETVLASLGGGGFLMARRADDPVPRLYDFFAQTPKRKLELTDSLEFFGIEADFGPATQEFHIGAASAAVPGLIPGIFHIHRELCSLPLQRIFEPAVRLAREGVPVTEFHAYLFTIITPILTATEKSRNYFCKDGRIMQAGDVYRNPELANTLEQLVREGLAFFTHGELGQAIAAQSDHGKGHLTLTDLQDYKVIERAPLICDYKGHEIAFNPAPAASGPLIAFGLNLFQKLRPDYSEPTPLELALILSETNAFRKKQNQYAPDQFDRELSDHLSRIKSHWSFSRGTTHISVIDGDGNAAAATVSNGEGNGNIVADFGIMLNNMLGEEDINPEGFHNWPLNSRLSTMMSPTLITQANTNKLIALGSGGSNRIRTAILQVIFNLIDGQMNIADAVSAPRLHLERDGKLSLEPTFRDADKEHLLQEFSNSEVWPKPNMFFGGVHTVSMEKDGKLDGAGDLRRAGFHIKV
ncbi:MAG: gamma-glutamyltransferase family protein [Methyloligellaceae bacterium]